MDTYYTMIIGVVFGILMVSIAFVGYIIGKRSDTKPVQTEQTKFIPLTYEQCEEILAVITDDVYKNKYYLQYRLRDVRIIPKMDEEIKNMTKDILEAMSDNLKMSFSYYYSEDYLIAMITRRVQMLLVEYTNNFKPNTK